MSMDRRIVVQFLAAAAAVAALPASAADAPKLDPKDPAAVALGYVDDVTKLDKKRQPDYVEGSSCENCLQLQGKAGAALRPCNLFPGKLVSSGGWCRSWAAEM
jgi:hypothetical protein